MTQNLTSRKLQAKPAKNKQKSSKWKSNVTSCQIGSPKKVLNDWFNKFTRSFINYFYNSNWRNKSGQVHLDFQHSSWVSFSWLEIQKEIPLEEVNFELAGFPHEHSNQDLSYPMREALAQLFSSFFSSCFPYQRYMLDLFPKSPQQAGYSFQNIICPYLETMSAFWTKY